MAKVLESHLQRRIIEDLESKGYYVVKLMKTNKNGIPDILAIPKDSDVFFIEAKTVTGILSALQRFRLKELKKHGIKVSVARNMNYEDLREADSVTDAYEIDMDCDHIVVRSEQKYMCMNCGQKFNKKPGNKKDPNKEPKQKLPRRYGV